MWDKCHTMRCLSAPRVCSKAEKMQSLDGTAQQMQKMHLVLILLLAVGCTQFVDCRIFFILCNLLGQVQTKESVGI